MRQGFKTGRKIVLYAGYGIVLTAALLYARFPSEAYLEYLQARVREINPHFRAAAAKVAPLFPVGLRFVEPRIARDDRPGADLFAARELRVTRTVASLLGRTYRYEFDAEAYGGRIGGDAAFVQNDLCAPLSASVRLADLSLQEHAYLQAVDRQSVTGVLAGTVRFSGRLDRWMEGLGDADLTVRDGRVRLASPVWNIDTVHVDEARVGFQLRERRLILTRAEIRGRELQGNLSGTIQLKENVGESRLNLRGTFQPFPALSRVLGGLLGGSLSSRLGRGVSFVIHGTVDDPDIKVL
jgi:type II secretion system protein N